MAKVSSMKSNCTKCSFEQTSHLVADTELFIRHFTNCILCGSPLAHKVLGTSIMCKKKGILVPTGAGAYQFLEETWKKIKA